MKPKLSSPDRELNTGAQSRYDRPRVKRIPVKKIEQLKKAINAPLENVEFYDTEVFNPASICAGAIFVMEELAAKRKVRFSEYYDGEDDKFRFLTKRIKAKNVEREMLPPLVDCAVAQLEEFGIVKTKSLPGILCDGENDYEITMVKRGKKNVS